MTIRAETGYIPLTETIACEICGKVVPGSDAHSLITVYAMPGPGIAAYQCRDEQHYACSHEHAVLANCACLFSHLLANHDYAGKGDPIQNSNYQNLVNVVNAYLSVEQEQPL